jgi:lipopolysaccharide transport system ATP-binding protein
MMIGRSEAIAPARPLIELHHVSKRFTLHQDSQRSFQETFIRLMQRRRDARHVFWSLQDVSLDVNQGDSLGIIGSNGSGKSTLLKLISGILVPTDGDIFARGRIASLLELGAGFHPDLTGRENIFLNGSILGLSRRRMNECLDQIIDFAELGEFVDVPIRHYSSGMYVRLGFAVAIHTEPDILLVDEVLAVGDASFQHKCMDSIQKFRARQGTLVFVSHDLGTIQSLCNQAIWLDGGRVCAAGQPTDVVMAYLSEVAYRDEKHAAGERAPDAQEGLHRWGSGKIRITRVELCDGAGAPRRIFANGSTLEVRLHYRAEGQVEDPVFGIAIHHQNGAHICGPNTNFSGLRIPFVAGTGQVIYRIPRLPLMDGAYLISVAVTNRADTEMYDYHDRTYACRVSVGASHERYGVVALDGEWVVEPDVASAQTNER